MQKNNPSALHQQISKDIDCDLADYNELIFSINNDEISVKTSTTDIAAYQLVIMLGWYKNENQIFYKDIAYSAALYLKSKKVAVWNSEVLNQRSTTKLSAMISLALAGIRVPNTWFSLKPENLFKAIKDLNQKYVYKAIAASRGDHNYLINNLEEINTIKASKCMMLQEYLPNKSDLRIICAGFEPIYAIERSASTGSHLNNVSQGGSYQQLDLESLDPGAIAIAEQSARILNREMGGVDLIFDPKSQEYVCLEVNSLPQLTSGANVDGKLDALVRALKQYLEGKQ